MSMRISHSLVVMETIQYFQFSSVGIFSFFTMKDSNKVRLTCRECRQAVMDFPWMDMRFSTDSHIKGSIKAWRAAFPVVSNRKDIVDADFGDADFVHIRGMRVYGYTV